MNDLTTLLLPTRSCMASHLRRASRGVTQHYERHFKGSSLRSTQFTMLSMIAQIGPTPVTRLADRLGMERTTLTRNIQLLARRGLVTVSGDGDARVRRVAITDAGIAALREAMPFWQAAQASVGALLTRLHVQIPPT